MSRGGGTGVAWLVSTATLGVIVSACALSAYVSPTAGPHPEPGQVAAAAVTTGQTVHARSTCPTAPAGEGPLACSVPACAGTPCTTDLATAGPPTFDLEWRSMPTLVAPAAHQPVKV